MIVKVFLGIVAGLAVGYAIKTHREADENAVNKTVHDAYLLNDGKRLGGMMPCTRHPGNGLLMWSDGNLRCYRCGQEQFADSPGSVDPVVVYSPKQKQEMKDLLNL